MAERATRKTRTPRQRAQDEADLAMRKYERKAAQFQKSREATKALRAEAEALKADADFLLSHPLLNSDSSAEVESDEGESTEE